MEYTTAGGSTVKTGDLVFDYYSQEAVVIGRDCGSEGWFEVLEPGTSQRSTSGMLNGERICTLAEAVRYRHIEPEERIRLETEDSARLMAKHVNESYPGLARPEGGGF